MDATLLIEGALLVTKAGVGAQDLEQEILDHPEQRRFWWAYDFDSGARLYIEYRRN